MTKFVISLCILLVAGCNIQSSEGSIVSIIGTALSTALAIAKHVIQVPMNLWVKSVTAISEAADDGVKRLNGAVGSIITIANATISVSKIGSSFLKEISNDAKGLKDATNKLEGEVKGITSETSSKGNCTSAFIDYVENMEGITSAVTDCVGNAMRDIDHHFETILIGLRKFTTSLSKITNKIKLCAPYPLAYVACTEAVRNWIKADVIIHWTQIWAKLKTLIGEILIFHSKLTSCRSTSGFDNLLSNKAEDHEKIRKDSKACAAAHPGGVLISLG